MSKTDIRIQPDHTDRVAVGIACDVHRPKGCIGIGLDTEFLGHSERQLSKGTIGVDDAAVAHCLATAQVHRQ